MLIPGNVAKCDYYTVAVKAAKIRILKHIRSSRNAVFRVVLKRQVAATQLICLTQRATKLPVSESSVFYERTIFEHCCIENGLSRDP